MSEIQDLSFDEIDAVDGGLAMSMVFGAGSGILWGAAEVASVIPGGQGVGAFLGLGAGIFGAISGVAALAGD